MNKGKQILPKVIILLFMGIASVCRAQKLKPLSIGDKVPDIEFSLVNSTTSSVKLSDFKGKLVILDFWATWCGGCIVKFPKMDSLQTKFKNSLQILLVNDVRTNDTEVRIKEFFKKWTKKTGKPYPLASAVRDTVASRLFPYRGLPHYVWISSEGQVAAITSADEITEKNIKKALNNGDVAMPLKKDFFSRNPIFLGEEFSMNDLTSYSLFKKGRIDGLDQLFDIRTMKIGEKNIIRGHAMRNMSLLDMYKTAMIHILPQSRYYDRMLILEVMDSSKLIFNNTKGTKDAWEKDNLYTCDILVPASEADSLYNDMLDLLNKSSGFYGRVEKRTVPCLLLKRTGAEDKLATKGNKPGFQLYDKSGGYSRNLPLSRLVIGLNKLKCVDQLIFDETGYTGNIDIEFSATDVQDLDALRLALRRYGLDLMAAQKEIDVFVLEAKTALNNKTVTR